MVVPKLEIVTLIGCEPAAKGIDGEVMADILASSPLVITSLAPILGVAGREIPSKSSVGIVSVVPTAFNEEDVACRSGVVEDVEVYVGFTFIEFASRVLIAVFHEERLV